MEFIQVYADVDGDDDDNLTEDDLVSNQGDESFIDDSNISVGGDFYGGFENVDRNLNEPIDDYEDWLDQQDLHPENDLLYEVPRDSIEFDVFENVKARAGKFKSKCLTFKKGSNDSFYNAILYAVVFKISGKKDFFTDKNKIE